jgi:predicted MFS family arabinose efflux permease
VPALRVTALLHPVLLTAVVLTAHSDLPLPLLVAVTVLAGATVPPHGPVMRALWADALRGPALATAYSLESVVVELCFVLGPLLVASLTLALDPSAPVLAAGVLAGVGGLWLSTTARVVRSGRTANGTAAASGPCRPRRSERCC